LRNQTTANLNKSIARLSYRTVALIPSEMIEIVAASCASRN